MQTFLRIAAIIAGLATAQGGFAQPNGSGGPPKVNMSVFSTDHIRTVTAVTEVLGHGQRTTSLIVEYHEPVRSAALSADSFAVADRTILGVHAARAPTPGAVAQDGRFVVLTLDPADEAAVVYGPGIDVPAETLVSQIAPIQSVSGAAIPVTEAPVINTRQVNLIVDEFRQFRFIDPVTGAQLAYNLFVPEGYDPSQSYPLVVFMHDYGVTGTNPLRTLQQGLGAVSFASPEDQSRHPAFVLAPQYPVGLAKDAGQVSDYADVTVRLIEDLTGTYSIARKRLYVTGQSGDCMTAIALNIRYPELFAASLLVAGQWDPAQVAPMAGQNIWAIVSQDDTKAFPVMTAIMEVLESVGATVTRASWNTRATPEEFAALVAQAPASGADSNVFFTAFEAGSVLPETGDAGPGAGHVNTWVYAYAIPGVRDWLFEQSR